ncbi:MAG: metallophosphoesterase [Geminicoccaceae bacterium]
MILIGIVVTWLTMVAPITVLMSWLFEQAPGTWLLASLLLGPFAFIGLWWTIQNSNLRVRWPVMQYFGWGTVLLPLTFTGMIATIWVSPQTVGFAVLLAWLVLGTIGVIAATRIAERSLTFDHVLLDRPYKLVQLSDVHVGSRSANFLRRAIEQALSHRPDAMLLTGDLIDASAVKSEDLNALGEIPCPVYFTLGNHERYIDLDAAIAMIESQGVDLLRGQAITQGQLQIVGIDDADNPDQVGDHLPGIELSDNHYRILLYHRPDGWQAARQAGIDLMLAGHTHGGQIWPFNYVVKQRFEHLLGLFSEDDRHLYVSPGTGCWGPIMRLGTRSEMTVIDLVPTAAAEIANTS